MPARSLLSARPKIQIAVIALASMLVVGYLYGANLRAKWSVFDDHEIMWFIGREEHLPVSRIVPQLLLTEVGTQSDLPRFRPSYYGLRLVESWAWGKRPELWYAAHLLILAFFMSTTWALASMRIGFLPSAMLAAYTVALPFWSGVFSALGPSESYAALGLALFLLGADFVFRRYRSHLGWCLLLAGTIVAAGAKENMLLLALPLPGLLLYERRHQGSKWLAASVTALGVAWCAWIAFVVLARARAVGGDVYANPISLSQRLISVSRLWRDPGVYGLAGVVVVFFFLWWFWRRRNAAMERASLLGVAWSILFLGIFASQEVFYNGSWPTGTRYDFPGLLVWPGLLVLVSWYIRRLSSLPARAEQRTLIAGVISHLDSDRSRRQHTKCACRSDRCRE